MSKEVWELKQEIKYLKQELNILRYRINKIEDDFREKFEPKPQKKVEDKFSFKEPTFQFTPNNLDSPFRSNTLNFNFKIPTKDTKNDL